MKSLASFILFLMFSSYSLAADMPSTNAASASTEIGNMVCPVSGDKIKNSSKAIKYEYQGHIYNLCCKMCMKDFSKDPEKYADIAEKSVQN